MATNVPTPGQPTGGLTPHNFNDTHKQKISDLLKELQKLPPGTKIDLGKGGGAAWKVSYET